MGTKKVFLSDKYSVRIKHKNGEIKDLDVYVTLEQNKLGNYIKIPDEVYEQMQSELAAADGEKAKGFL